MVENKLIYSHWPTRWKRSPKLARYLAADIEAQNDPISSSEVVRYDASVRFAATGVPLRCRQQVGVRMVSRFPTTKKMKIVVGPFLRGGCTRDAPHAGPQEQGASKPLVHFDEQFYKRWCVRQRRVRLRGALWLPLVKCAGPSHLLYAPFLLFSAFMLCKPTLFLRAPHSPSEDALDGRLAPPSCIRSPPLEFCQAT